MKLSHKVFSHPLHWLAFGFGAGLSPVAPGTMGTLVAIPIIMLMSFFSLPIYIAITLVTIILGTYAADWSSRDLKVHDHSGIVIDEIAGMMIVMLFVPINALTLLEGFALFRLFDIVKPWPINWLDKQIKGGVGIMVDDLLAALYAGVVLKLVQLLI
ncbi:MAG: phosphatidylglycerophosphatase A [Gammaproteobacteria bacterium]